MSKNLKETLLEIKDNPMEAQQKILNEKIEIWKKGCQQLDDILMVGIKI